MGSLQLAIEILRDSNGIIAICYLNFRRVPAEYFIGFRRVPGQFLSPPFFSTPALLLMLMLLLLLAALLCSSLSSFGWV